MKMVKTKAKDPTYYGQVGYRDGKKTSTNNVLYFGKKSEILKQHDDPEAYVRSEIAKWNEEHKKRRYIEMKYDLNEKVESVENEEGETTAINIGYFYLQYILKDLHLKEFCDKYFKDYRFKYNAYDILRYLIYERIIDPDSKLQSSKETRTYFGDFDFEYHDILRFMDVLVGADKDDLIKDPGQPLPTEVPYIEWLFNKSNKIVKRDFSTVYYDCTNFYYEINRADDAFIDPETGEVLEHPMRKYGISKEHRPNPLVEFGLFTDAQGIPITMCLVPGNTAECTTTLPLEEKVCDMLKDNSDFIYCSDGGLGTYNIRNFNNMGGRHFVVSQSCKKLKSPLKKALFNDYDYRMLSDNSYVHIADLQALDPEKDKDNTLYNDFAFKVVKATVYPDLGSVDAVRDKDGSPVKDENGQIQTEKVDDKIDQYLIMTFSRKLQAYQRRVRNSQIERAKQLIATCKDPDEIKKTPNDIRRFIKTIKKGSKSETVNFSYVLDDERIEEEEKYDGYGCIATNLVASAKKIIGIAQRRNKIEYCFRMMKTNHDCRPIWHREPRRIRAHFLLCYTALLVQRLLEVKLDEIGCHVTADNLQNALKVMTVNGDKGMYTALYRAGNTMRSLEKLTGLGLDHKYNTAAMLNSKIRPLLK